MHWETAAAVWVAMVMCASALIAHDDDMTLVPTPFGWRPKQCVHSWPSGTAITEEVGKNRTHIRLPDGKEMLLPRLPECMKEAYVGPDGLTHSRVSSGWLDNAYDFTDTVDPYVPCPSLPQPSTNNSLALCRSLSLSFAFSQDGGCVALQWHVHSPHHPNNARRSVVLLPRDAERRWQPWLDDLAAGVDIHSDSDW
jgi:hypothetical protein